MSFASRHKKGGIQWGIDTEGFEYYALKDLFEIDETAVWNLRGVFINKNKTEKELKEYGPSVVGILPDRLINLPNHMLEEVKEMMASEEDIEELKAGKVFFRIRTYESHGKTCYSPDWVEPEEVPAEDPKSKK